MLRRILINPLATLIFAGLLVADFATLPTSQAREFGSSRIAATIRHRSSSSYGNFASNSAFARAYFVLRDGLVTRADPDNDSWDEMSRIIVAHPETVLLLEFWGGTYRYGLWAITRETQTYTINTEMGSGFSAQQRNEARSRFVRDLSSARAYLSPTATQSLLTENFWHTRFLWLGYAHNVLALLCLILLLNSVRWIPRTPAYFRARRAARGLCPHCGYSRAGLTTPTCPECGRPIEPRV